MPEPSETTPLITRAATAPKKHRAAIFVIALVVSLLINLAGSILTSSITVLCESAICRQLHPDVPDPFRDSVCKEMEVQWRVMSLIALNTIVGAVCGGLVVVPYGRLADRWGRKWVLVLSIASSLVIHAAQILITWFPSVLSVKLIWLATGLATIGGGPFVSFTMLSTIACDISTAAQRSGALFILGGTAMVANLVSPFVVAAMLRQNIWLSLYIGLGVLALACIAATLIPESRDAGETQDANSPVLPESAAISSPAWFWRLVKEASPNFGDNQVYAGGLFAATLCAGFVTTITGLLAALGTVRYQWDFTNVAFMELLLGSIQSGVMLVILPLASFALSRQGISPALKDLWLSKGSILAQGVGVLIFAVAWTEAVFIVGVVFCALGIGSLMALRAAVTNITSSKTLAVANSIITATVALSTAVTAVVWFVAASVEIRAAFWASAGLCIIALGILSAMHPAAPSHEADDD